MPNISGDRMDALIQRHEREMARRHQRVREIIFAEGRPDLVAELDTKMRDIRLGIDGAQRTWGSISPAQRRVLLLLMEGNRKLVRSRVSVHFYDAIGEPHAVAKAAGLKTVRNLARRELLSWDGGAFDPERVALLTERARFVVKHGQ